MGRARLLRGLDDGLGAEALDHHGHQEGQRARHLARVGARRPSREERDGEVAAPLGSVGEPEEQGAERLAPLVGGERGRGQVAQRRRAHLCALVAEPVDLTRKRPAAAAAAAAVGGGPASARTDRGLVVRVVIVVRVAVSLRKAELLRLPRLAKLRLAQREDCLEATVPWRSGRRRSGSGRGHEGGRRHGGARGARSGIRCLRRRPHHWCGRSRRRLGAGLNVGIAQAKRP